MLDSYYVRVRNKFKHTIHNIITNEVLQIFVHMVSIKLTEINFKIFTHVP